MRHVGTGIMMALLMVACGDDDGGNDNQNTNQNDTPPICGDGQLDVGEVCDEGAANSDTAADACRSDCRPARCGDGVVDSSEGCDEEGANSDRLPGACRTDCQPARCGDGVVDPGETCDDANGDAGDGCDGACGTEPHWLCDGVPSQCACEDYHLSPDCTRCVVFVDVATTSATPTGRSWDTALPGIQEGLDLAADLGPGCQVWVAEGTYRVFDFGLLDSLHLRSHVAIYGGFQGGETSIDQRDWVNHETILEAYEPTMVEPVVHVITADSVQGARVDGFVIQHGYAQGAREEDNVGGGVYAVGSEVTFANCRIQENHSAFGGAGIYAYGSALTLTDTHVHNNTNNAGDGPGMYLVSSHAVLDRVWLTFNHSGGPVELTDPKGGGVYAFLSSLQITNGLVASNFLTGATTKGGGIYSHFSNLSLLHCTVANNTAALGGSLSADPGPGNVTALVNSVLEGDMDVDSTTTADYCVLPSVISGGTGNHIGGPGFVSGSYRPSVTSPCIDAADGTRATAHDLDGLARFDVTTVVDAVDCTGVPQCVPAADIGALEYSE